MDVDLFKALVSAIGALAGAVIALVGAVVYQYRKGQTRADRHAREIGDLNKALRDSEKARREDMGRVIPTLSQAVEAHRQQNADTAQLLEFVNGELTKRRRRRPRRNA